MKLTWNLPTDVQRVAYGIRIPSEITLITQAPLYVMLYDGGIFYPCRVTIVISAISVEFIFTSDKNNFVCAYIASAPNVGMAQWRSHQMYEYMLGLTSLTPNELMRMGLKRSELFKPNKKVIRKMRLEALYLDWTGEAAQQLEATNHGLSHMVLVDRHVGKRVSTNQYMFSCESVARACYQYWMARGGLVRLALVQVEDEYGYTEHHGF